MRPQFQQPLSAEMLSQQQQSMMKLQQQQQHHPAVSAIAGVGIAVNSPKRVELNPSNRQQLLSQTIIHQTYGVQQPQPPLAQSHILAQYQNQQSTNVAANLQLRQISASTVIPSNYSTSSPSSQQPSSTGIVTPPLQIQQSDAASSFNRNLACLPMSYYPPQQSFGAAGDPTAAAIQVRISEFSKTLKCFLTFHVFIDFQVPAVHSAEPRFPPAISVNRLAPQVSFHHVLGDLLFSKNFFILIIRTGATSIKRNPRIDQRLSANVWSISIAAKFINSNTFPNSNWPAEANAGNSIFPGAIVILEN